MDKIEYRAVIKYLVLKGNMYGDSAPSFITVKFLAAEFKRGRKSLGDDERSGRPKTATTDDNIAKVHQIVLDDRRIKVRGIAEVMNISKERVCHILNQDLGMRKMSVRALGAAFAHVRPKACSYEHFQRLCWRSLGAINPSFGID
ncbi:protein GVQW3-like [Sitophilus oryzae]|uniref:Protein GVQW3-like n=1 Tax=Sitophilus oryzae TaxID=7048 RepID=A0A6J2YAV7_SITOR|nr:protein GVQW3-like [Sitophilus oryzae]